MYSFINKIMKQTIKQFLLETAPRWRTRKIKENPAMYRWIQNCYPGVQLNIVLDCILKDRDPYCCICGNPIKNLGKLTCSNVCGTKIVDYQSRSKKTKKTLNRNPEIMSQLHKKRIQTLEEKYGAKVSPVARQAAKNRAKLLNEKGKRTLKQKYSVDNPGQLPNHTEKCKKTLLKNYGVDNYFDSDQFKQNRLTNHKLKYQSLTETAEIISVAEPSDLIQYNNPNLRICFECKTCGNQETLPSETWKWRHRTFNNPCAKCNDLINGSNQENQVRNFINQKLNIKTLDHYKLPNRKEIDIFIPHLNIGFEYDGLYWHNHTRIDQNYHIDKTNYCFQQGIQLFHIFEDEWLHKPWIVKSRIRFILNKTVDQIYARKCIIREIDSKTANMFLNQNHLQGAGRSNVRVGLYYNNQLVSVMTFLKGDISKRLTDWELNRFCSKIDTSVAGAAGKLFSYTIKKYNINKIISFSDRRWSQKNSIYQTLNFEFIHNTKPNYWYFLPKDIKRIHRYALRKPTHSALSEMDLRAQQGYLRIYDCGSSKWIWKKNGG
jgi:hypothetical protein